MTEKIFTDKVLYDTFMQMNTSLTEMNAELKSLRKDFGQMKELWERYDQLQKVVSDIQNQQLGKNKLLETVRNWGALAVAMGALVLNLLR